MPGKILVVEDDKIMRPYAIRGLAQAGWQVEEAGSGQAALEIFQQATFDTLTHQRKQQVTPLSDTPLNLPELPQTEVHPPLLRTNFVPQPKLLTTLHQAITNHQLTLISAPAGYGKTTWLEGNQ